MEENKKIKLSCVMIVKNESSCLERCLKTLKGFDEIIICDTGSEDNTIEIAKKYTDKVYDDYKWNDNFSEARNHALGKATGDWVLSIDADEELLNSVDEIKKVVGEAEEKGVKAVNVTQVSGTQSNVFPRLFKKCPEVYWCGAIHNYLSIPVRTDSDIKIRYYYSAAHKKDPNRALRILKKEAEKGGKSRELYYLAREYWYRKDYITAIYWLDEYLAVSKFLAEKADGYLMAARCYWALKKGDTARKYCLMALNINANFKEALEFMAEMSWEASAKSWRKYAELATNEGLLFVRNIKPATTDTIEVCFLVYQRPERLPEILKQLQAQTIQNFKVNIWNNSGKELDIGDFPKDKIKIIDSKENIGSQARFKLAKQTTGNPIIFFDDDEDLAPNFIEYHYNQYLKFGKKCILGWFTRTFDKNYWESKGANYGEEVDYVGTGGMVLDREIFEKEPLLQDIPKLFKKTEDLYLCYLARMKHGMKLIKIEPACSILVDDKDQYKDINKEEIFKELRKMGWRLLKDKNAKRDKEYWDKRYKTGNSGIGSYDEWLDFKLKRIKAISGVSSILDIGFGDLNTGLQVASLFPKASYLGLDISETAFQQAKAKKLDKCFQFKLIENSVFSHPSDLVICLDVLWHITQDKDYEDMLKSLKQSWKKHLFLTAHKDECVNLHTASHIKIRKFDPTYFSKNYKKTLIPLGDKNIYLYHFWK